MNQHTVLNVELQDVDVEYSLLQALTATDFSEVEITKVTFRGVDITRKLKRKEISSIALDIENDLDNAPLSKEDDDPTPYCSGCKAKFRKDCNCGPTAEND